MPQWINICRKKLRSISFMCNEQTIPATHGGTLQLLPRETECENDFIRVEIVSKKQNKMGLFHTRILLDRDIFWASSRWCFLFFCLQSCFPIIIKVWWSEITQHYGIYWENHVSPNFSCTVSQKSPKFRETRFSNNNHITFLPLYVLKWHHTWSIPGLSELKSLPPRRAGSVSR